MPLKANKMRCAYRHIISPVTKKMRTTPDNLHNPHNHGHQSGFSLLKNNFIALYTLIVVTCLVTFWVWADRDTREMRYVYLADRVVSGELYRHLTAGFLHKNEDHLKGNMGALLIAGMIVCHRTKMSNIKFFLFYLSAIICASYFCHRYQMSYLYVSDIAGALGSSGGVYAVKFASFLLIFNPRSTKNIKHKQILSIVLFCYFFAKVYNDLVSPRVDDIAHEAHFGGALYGIAFAIFFYPKQIFAGLFAGEPDSPEDSASDLLLPFADKPDPAEDSASDLLLP